MDLKSKAAAETAWASNRAKAYAEDGTAVPEPLRRLLELARAVEEEPAAVAQAPDTKSREDAARALTDASTVLLGIARALQEGQPASPVTDARSGPRVVDAVAPLAKPAESISAAVAPAARVPMSLWSGVVLRHRERGYLVRLNEQMGTWTIQNVNADGTFGDTAGAKPETFFADVWSVYEAPLPVAAAAARSPEAPATKTQTVIPGTVPETPAGPVVAKIADWTPDAVYIAQAVQALTVKCPTAGVSESVIRSLVDRFKREKGDVAAPKPATTFHHWAVKTLNGGGK